MNKQLWEKLDNFRSLPFHGHEGLAGYLKKEGIHFSTKDFSAWGRFFSFSFGGSRGQLQVPEWLASVFCGLAKEVSPKKICDPWAGVGFLVESLREACKPQKTLAFTQNQDENEIGNVLAPQVSWKLGNPLLLLDSLPETFDLFASVLPFGLMSQLPLKVTLLNGNEEELKDDLGNLVLVASSMRLGSSGLGLFIVTPTFFTKKQSVFHKLGELGLGVEAALALPFGAFAPYTNIRSYLVVVRQRPTSKMFVAQLSTDIKANFKIIENFHQEKEGGSLELGRFVDSLLFKSIEHLRIMEDIAIAEKRFGFQATNLAELADVKLGIDLGRSSDEFSFETLDDAIYIPLLGTSEVVDSIDKLKLKAHNYAQVLIDPSRSNASFVARFLNSDFGKVLLEQTRVGGVFQRSNRQTLKELRIFVPDLKTQKEMLEIEARIANEHTTVMALQNEISELRSELWANPKFAPQIQVKINELALRLSGDIKQHVSESLSQWFETLPFPQASILRAWQATPTQECKTQYEHLLHFFEATAEFVGIILLSAFCSNEAVFALHRQKLTESMQKQNLSFNRATFGTWKLVIEYLGKQTRDLLNENGKEVDNAKEDRALCADMFADTSLSFPEALSRKELSAIFSATNKMRNDWSGHGGVVGNNEAKLRNAQLLAQVEKLREVVATTWSETQLILPLNCRPRNGVFENEVSILMGSNNEFLKETREMVMWLDVDSLYLSKNNSGIAMKLLPLIRIGSSPQSAKNACYFFSRIDKDGARFISYHFVDNPELTGQFTNATEAIKLLTGI